MDVLGPRRLGLLATAAVAAAAVLASPATAGAATLAVQGSCFASNQRVVVTGTAFTPGAPVDLGGAASGAAQADATGAFTTEIHAPALSALGPTTVSVTAVDRANPANTATVELRVVRSAFGSNFPLAGSPHATATWQFAGFATGQPIYGHFLLDGRSHGDFRFGVATGPCGTLTVRAARIPGVRDLRPGHWTLKLDQHKSYRDHTQGSEVSFRIRRRGDNRDGGDRGGDGGKGHG
jgi:hypothetical protein